MVTFRNNNRRNNFRRNDRGFKSNGDRTKFGSNYSNNENFQRKVPGRNNHNAPKLIIEIAFNQKEEVKQLLRKNSFYVNSVIKDLGNNNRCIISTKVEK